MVIHVDWNERYLLGFPDIDEQHRQIAFAVGELADAIYAHPDRSTWDRITEKLIDSTRQHFEYEERMMRLAGYPNSGGHEAQHAELLEQIKRFCAAEDPGNLRPREGSSRAVSFLHRWLEQHVTLSDRPMVEWLRGPAARSPQADPDGA